MKSSISLALLSLAILGLVPSGLNAQQGGAGGGKPTTSKIPPRVTPTMPTVPSQTSYYTGKVVMDTGIAPPTPVAVLRVCNGLSRRETFTSADGAFSFIVGDKINEVMADASDDSRGFGADSQYSRSMVPGMGQTNNPQSPLADCELRADLSGYTSSSVRLDPSMNNSNVGVIVLHSRTKKADGMVTVASLAVPAKARKDYERGSELLEKGNLPEAEKSLRKAIDQYPKFAEAWTRLGDLEQRRKDRDAAIKDYQEAINADPNLPIPYLRMALLEAVAGDYEQTRKLTEKLISLDPSDFPLAYYYNAVAEFNLKHLEKAESSALRAENMDKQHAEPRVELLLASIYIAKGSYSSATDHYRAYLKLVPDGPLTERVKTDLAKTEELAKSRPPASVPGDK
jgi:tetratricopeptide (TPR) repeat protein